jgi:hypothetical protein
MPANGLLDPALDRWLRSIEPRQELVVRYAMSSHFAEVRGNKKFSARVDELKAQLRPNPTQRAMILAEARKVAKFVVLLIRHSPDEPGRRSVDRTLFNH